MEKIESYLNDVSALLAEIPRDKIAKVVDLVRDAYEKGTQVFIMGNGGSASTSSHLACDLQKGLGGLSDKKFKVMALSDSIPIMTAWGNDTDYSNIFAPQLETWVNPGDLVIGISGSGNSPNVINAIELANKKGAITVGLSGFQGGKLDQLAQYGVVVRSDNMQHIEDVHMVLAHLIFRVLMEELWAKA
jgi:D-sedoheptulose 7-phosphate isomerase